MSGDLFHHVYGVILAGGSGTRLWPLSTQKNPKQFLSVGLGDSLIGQTAARILQMMPAENLRVVCGAKYAELLAQYLPMIQSPQVYVEPRPRNTAAAIALAAALLYRQDPEAVMLVSPADHLIFPDSWPSFVKDVRLAVELALQKEALITFGIPPEYPSTGFGYLEIGAAELLHGQAYYQLKAFREKPPLALAEEYVRQRQFFWNSGIFVWKAATFLKALAVCQPDMHALFEEYLSAPDAQSLSEIYDRVESISVDYAVMEKAQNTLMVQASFAWDDVGSLTSFAKALPQDTEGNCKAGDAYFVDAKNNLIISHTKPIALVGVEDLIVVETEKALLVVSKKQAQDVKKMVDLLEKKSRHDLL